VVTAGPAAPKGEIGTGGATPPATRSIVHLVHNTFTHDTRVLSEARSAAAGGDVVAVAAVSGRDLPEREEAGGVRTIRFSFDPIDTRFWRNRSRVSRPWRFRRQAAGWAVRESRGGPPGCVRAGAGVVAAVVALPWVAVTIVYHFGMRLLDAVLRLVHVPAPSRIVGEWIEARARSAVFVGHRPLRLRDWGRRIERAVEVGDLPSADVWHADDLETLPLALGLRRRFGGRVVFDSHELFLDAAGRVRMGWFRRAILRAAERRWIVQADAVVTVNRAVATELRRRYGIAMPVVVRNCRPLWSPPPGFVSPIRAAVAAAGLDPVRPIVIAHGGFQAERGFEETLAATIDLPDVNVVFLGYGPLDASFRAIAAAPPWRGRLAVLPPVAPDDVVPWLAGADVSACLIQPTTVNHRLSTPNKLFEAIMAGVPIVASDLPAIAEIVTSFGVGRLVGPRDRAATTAAIGSYLAMGDEECAEQRASARHAATVEINWEHEFVALAALYDSLVPPNMPGQLTATSA
jgi:glycosyltransferase involved in cell wall biosynthesis